MTEVQFHFNVPDRLVYTCRLLRKALLRQSGRVAVTGEAATLAELDRLLWTFEPQEFLPHARLVAGAPPTPLHRRTPVWLVDDAGEALDAAGASPMPVLVNLGADPARGFESFERLIEVVAADAADRDAGRRRWKHYASRGYVVKGHEVSA